MRAPRYATLYVLLLGSCFGQQEIHLNIKTHGVTERKLADSDEIAVLGSAIEISGPEGEYLDAIRAAIPKLPGRIKLKVGDNVPHWWSGSLHTQVAIDAQWLALPQMTTQRSTLEIGIDSKRSSAAAIGKAVGEAVLKQLLAAQPKQAAIPVPAPPARAVTVSSRFGCTLHTDRSVHCWGHAEPLIGFVPSKTPLTDVVEVDVGDTMVCARRESGDIACIGPGREPGFSPPYEVGQVCDIAHATRLIAGWSLGCAIVDQGKVRCWNSDEKNPLGSACTYPSTEISGVRGATDLAFGGQLCALTPGGVLCFGTALGIDKTAKPIPLPTGTALLSGLPVCVLQASGRILCDRHDTVGKLLERALPAGAKAEMSNMYGCAILPDKKQVCWGRDDGHAFGELQGTLASEPPLEHVVAQGLAFAGNCAVTEDGAVLCRGNVLPHSPRTSSSNARPLTKVTIY